ncbi:MAG: TetR/AcrR family transcriptional regulator [Oscillospiraceae bacterium]|nr:TetR/AcrR family transcriptional regulator [Oscillospiraceae bacterium]
MSEQSLTIKRKRIMIYFIEATRNLIQTEGVDGLSIRKIATEAGYNSATIYHYFSDLEHLTLFGSVCYLRDYIIKLSVTLNKDMTSIERFRTMYHCFNEFAFRNPAIFHNLFFGKHSHKLGEVLNTYYNELFPEELSGISESMRRVLLTGTMLERDRITMRDMVIDGFVNPEKADMTLELLIAVHQNYIYDAYLQGEQLDYDAHLSRFDNVMQYILDAAK